jgi:tRNA threonylcarbamoyladenosine biosynthesis protein TsaE
MLAVLHGRLTLHHMDWYRVTSPEDLETIGCEEYLSGGGVSAVEWADRVPEAIPPRAIRIDFTLEIGDLRTVILRGDPAILKEDLSFPAPLRAERIR